MLLPGLLVLWLLASNVDPSVAGHELFSFVTGLAGWSAYEVGRPRRSASGGARRRVAPGLRRRRGRRPRLLTAVITVALAPLVPSCAAPRMPVAEPVYSADAVYDQVRESTVLAVENAKHAVGMA